MGKLVEVDEAKALMTEAAEWSVMKWLREKKRVRRMADRANEALDQLIVQLQKSWSAELSAAYQASANGASAAPEVRAAAAQLRRAHDDARRARAVAEQTFDEAERQLSAAMAREGCRKAISSWELHEKAIRLSEGFIAPSAKPR